MRTRVSVAVLILLLGSSAGPSAFGQQAKWKPFSERRPLTNVGAMLNQDAESSDPAAIHSYAEDLAHFLLPDRVGERYLNSFADRLTKAEQEAREGKRQLIPDTQVAEAFDEIAKTTSLPAMPNSLEALRQLRTDPRIVRKYPALITADRNGTNVSPGEAVYLIAVLLLKDAYPPPDPSCPTSPPPPRPRAARPGDILPPPRAVRPGDLLPPPPPETTLLMMIPVENGAHCDVLTSKDIDIVALEGPDTDAMLQKSDRESRQRVNGPRKVKRSPALGRHGLAELFNSAAKTLGF